MNQSQQIKKALDRIDAQVDRLRQTVENVGKDKISANTLPTSSADSPSPSPNEPSTK